MEIGLLIRWGKLVPGREEQAIDLFAEGVEFFGKKLADGVFTFFEPFFYQTSDREFETGFFLIKGPMPEVFKAMEEDEYLMLVEKAMVLVEHFQLDLLTVGDGISEQLARSAKARAELGI